ncbi:MAG: FkbM family methyltransferase [Ahniella sp.]|nr:FkbM family methyltransferase [Ahniella sp.]
MSRRFRCDFLDVWPNCLVSCFEPQPGKQAKIHERFAGNQRVRVFGDLLSSRSGEELTLSLVETASSVLSEHVAKHARSRTFESVALDDWWERSDRIDPPDFIKLDVQGFELEVLKGAERLLPNVEVILAEVNLLDIHKDVPLVHEVSNWLADHGFVSFDVAGLTRRPLDRALWQMDLVFVRRDGRFRMDKRWAASS